ncbi:MAG: bifunctional glutamate N-acetyltransferase/amino-acid acetyltransferase ArgJ [Proteobacteria bacterium]|nr:bifunctional glutamate N-acetyltransferase/amino-acid acetyltransferase ArgJ [Pseudomonadota bacterium]
MPSIQPKDNFGQVFAIEGLTLGVASAAIRKKDRLDLVVLLLKETATVAGVFTQNNFCAAPVQVCRQRLSQGKPIKAMVINTGVANAGTGAGGIEDAKNICRELAQLLKVDPDSVLPFSTGVIMERLPVDKIIAGLPRCLETQMTMGWEEASQGILTTDLVPKISSRSFQIEEQSINVTGMAKGSGMIKPNMATMLAFVATDAHVSDKCLDEIVRYANDRTFNCISVDGDTSTNDSFMLIATGACDGLKITSADNPAFVKIRDEITSVCEDLAKKIVLDGEGATKFIEIRLKDCQSISEAREVGFSVANSPLVKTAFYASDANLGRIMSAIGAARVRDLDVSKIDMWIGDVLVAKNGESAPSYREVDVKPFMESDEIVVTISLGRGKDSGIIWTCDLSHDYIKINAEYRS